jgi:caffeoyl-CoA O-methyltransferase
LKGVPLNEELYQYILNTFVEEDDILKSIVKTTEELNLPLIQVSPENGQFLHMLIKMIHAKCVLEIGTLTGYSAVWMARGLPDDGKLTTLEFEKKHADVAKENFKKAKLENKIELILGSAIESLDKIASQKFDFAFIDADKVSYPAYLEKVLPMMNHGGIITADNTLRDGEVVSKNPDESVRGILRFNEMMANDERLLSLLVPISDGLTVGLVK